MVVGTYTCNLLQYIYRQYHENSPVVMTGRIFAAWNTAIILCKAKASNTATKSVGLKICESVI